MSVPTDRETAAARYEAGINEEKLSKITRGSIERLGYRADD